MEKEKLEILNAMEVAGLSAGETLSSLSSLGRRKDEGRRRDESDGTTND